MALKKKKESQEKRAFHKEMFREMVNLGTSAFGLIAALAWNEFIKEMINTLIKPLLGADSGIISLLIYAVAVTILAVFVTYNLSRFVKKD